MAKRINKTGLITALLFVLLIVAASAPAYFFYTKYQESQTLLKNPQKAAEIEIKAITDQLGKLMVLPDKEQPTVATVQDKSKLADQPFFAKAEVGDKVLIYTEAKKAILYRPKANKIIEVGPVTITPQEQTEGAANGSPAPEGQPPAEEQTQPAATPQPPAATVRPAATPAAQPTNAPAASPEQ